MKKWIALFLCVASLCLVACSGGVEAKEIATWKEHTDIEIFQDIPAFTDPSKVRITSQGDYGDDHYVLELSGVAPATYTEYLDVLKNAGYETLIDNGATGIDNAVFATTVRKDKVTLTLSYARNQMKLYLSASKYVKNISPFLTYDAASVAANDPGAKTTLTMQQVPEYGNFFFIKLKNGHFIVNDGGWKTPITTVIEVLEAETPEGQIPVVDAWFISHEHEDHMEFMREAMPGGPQSFRLQVEGFYISQVNEDIAKRTNANLVGKGAVLATNFVNSKGEQTPVYRPHMGERYYFNDITVEVMYTQEQMPLTSYIDNLNPSSTWLMYNIEGQKFLLAGDAELINMQFVMGAYSEEYMDVDIMNNHHHCLNLYMDDLDYYAKIETLMYSTWGTYSIYWPKDVLAANLQIQDMGVEILAYIDGGKRLTFPYVVGTAETLTPLYPESTANCLLREKQWRDAAGVPHILDY